MFNFEEVQFINIFFCWIVLSVVSRRALYLVPDSKDFAIISV